MTFNMLPIQPSTKNEKTGGALPRSVTSKQNSAKKIYAYGRLLINDKFVARTKTCLLKYPNYEIDLTEQFQIHMFTVPTSIKLELVMGVSKDILVDVINIDVPGEYVRALTSASSLIKEQSFSKFDFDKRVIEEKQEKQADKRDLIHEDDLKPKEKEKLEKQK